VWGAAGLESSWGKASYCNVNNGPAWRCGHAASWRTRGFLCAAA
jgi:hypothetical protein